MSGSGVTETNTSTTTTDVVNVTTNSTSMTDSETQTTTSTTETQTTTIVTTTSTPSPPPPPPTTTTTKLFVIAPDTTNASALSPNSTVSASSSSSSSDAFDSLQLLAILAILIIPVAIGVVYCYRAIDRWLGYKKYVAEFTSTDKDNINEENNDGTRRQQRELDNDASRLPGLSTGAWAMQSTHSQASLSTTIGNAVDLFGGGSPTTTAGATLVSKSTAAFGDFRVLQPTCDAKGNEGAAAAGAASGAAASPDGKNAFGSSMDDTFSDDGQGEGEGSSSSPGFVEGGETSLIEGGDNDESATFDVQRREQEKKAAAAVSLAVLRTLRNLD